MGSSPASLLGVGQRTRRPGPRLGAGEICEPAYDLGKGGKQAVTKGGLMATSARQQFVWDRVLAAGQPQISSAKWRRIRRRARLLARTSLLTMLVSVSAMACGTRASEGGTGAALGTSN